MQSCRIQLKVALIGCGFIGRTLAKAIDNEMKGHVELVSVYDELVEAASSLSDALNMKPRIAASLDEIFCDGGVELVIEAASQGVAKFCVPKALASGKHVMIMSVGVLADDDFYREVTKTAEEKHLRIHIPSGAIGGLDWIKAASNVGLRKVVITIRKPPKALEGSPYVTQNQIDLTAITTPTTIYEGYAAHAASAFPANVNVTVSLSLAGIGAQNTYVRIIADPTINRNIHEISAEGAAGTLTIKVENLPAPTNPKTSWVAALSAIQKVREMAGPISLGT